MKVVIEQPTYLSWAGYYGMIDIADTFVFYDDVQFTKQSWQQRNRIKTTNGSWIWLSVPVLHNFGQKINEVRIDNTVNWRRKHWESIYQSYHKTPYFKQYQDTLEEIYQEEYEYLADWSTHIIMQVSGLLGARIPDVVKSSELSGLTGHKTDRLVQLLNKIGADEYISGLGTRVYIEPGKFKDNDIKLYLYEYEPQVYPQTKGEFFPYMSVIDLLFNVGDEAINHIRKGVNLSDWR